MQGASEGALPEADWMGFITRAICDFGLGVEEAWHLSPQEWWECWSFKYGKRAKILRGDAVSDEEARTMAEDLEEAIRKERGE
jgi:hypothetical protein